MRCPLCLQSCTSIEALKKHINCRHVHKWKIPFPCGQENCSLSFDRASCLWRHLRKKHGACNVSTVSASAGDPDPCNDDTFMPSAEDDTISIDNCDFTIEEKTSRDELKKSIETGAAQFVASLRAKSDVTMTTIFLALDHCNDVVEKTADYLYVTVTEFLQSKGIVDVDLTELKQEFCQSSQPMEFLSTELKQENFFKQCKGFVAPISQTFGESHWLLQRKQDKIYHQSVHNTWMYVPIEQTLRLSLSIPEVANIVVQQRIPRNDGVLQDFVDGISFKSHPLQSDHPKTIFLALELYYDDLEITNPLGSKTKNHKLGVFYYRLKNLPSYFDSCSRNIHLIALARTSHLRIHDGYGTVLRKISSDIRHLETDGFDFILPNGQSQKAKAAIVVFNGDNLARHTIFGFFEGFTAIRFCETCMVSRHDEPYKCYESEVELRTREMVDAQVSKISQDPSCRKLYGIKARCVLHDTKYFHMTNNKTGDLMHDLLEGVGCLELQLVLDNLIDVKKYFTLEELNFRIQSFPYGATDIKNKPSAVAAVKPSTQGKTINQKAFQTWCLLRLLPQIIGHLVPQSDPYWLFYLKLRELMDILFAQKWTGGMVTQFSELYGDHLTEFAHLFPDARLSCKHHFLIHYPTFALHSGPPYKMMVAAMEMKMNHIKRRAHIMCNFMNAPYTLAKAHQFFAYFQYCSGSMYKELIQVVKSEILLVSSLPTVIGL